MKKPSSKKATLSVCMIVKNEEKNNEIEKNSEDSEEISGFLNENDSFYANFFAIDLVWKLIQDESPFSLSKINESLEFFR